MPLYYDTPPAENPLDLQELKDHLRIGSGSSYDTILDALIQAVTDPTDINNVAQYDLKRQLIQATLVFTLSEFSEKIEIPRPPLIEVESVEYRDDNGDWQTIDSASYDVNDKADPGYIRFLDYELPDTYEYEEYPIRITYKAGYANGENSTFAQVPANIRLLLMNHIGNYFEIRKSELVGMASRLEIVELKSSMGRLKAPHNAARRFG